MKNSTRFTFGLLVLVAVASAQQYTISTIAGGVPAPTLRSMTVDAVGNVYFASGDFGNSVFKLDTTGALKRIAGTSRNDFSGDGGPATSAPLFSPQGLAVDRAGNLFIADKGNQRIRRVSPDGIITTVAGGGSTGLGDNGPATSAQLNYPGGLAVDSAGNLFIGELGRVRKVTPDGIITTVAGGGNTDLGDGGPATGAQLKYVDAVAVDRAGGLFIRDQDRRTIRIRKISPSGIITTVADGGFCCEVTMAVDGAGNLFIADGNRIRKISPSGSSTIVAGNGSYGFSGDGGPATQAPLFPITALAVDGPGNLYIAGTQSFLNSHRIRKVSPDGIISTPPGGVLLSTPLSTGDGGPATSAQLQLSLPGFRGQNVVAVDGAGNLFIADTGNHRVRKVSPSGIITTVAGAGPCPDELYRVDCIPLGDGGPAIAAALPLPQSVAVDTKGNLFIASNLRVRKVSPDGTITTVAGNGTSGSSGDGGPATSAQVNAAAIAADGAGNLFISDGGIRKVSADGTIATILPSAIAATLAFDNEGNLFMAGFQCDSDDDCYSLVKKLSTSGVLSTVAGVSGYFGVSGDGGPATAAHLGITGGIAVDRAGNLFLTDLLDHRIRRISSDGIITTIIGGVNSGYAGDGGLAIHGTLKNPFALAANAAGDVYVADGYNQAVRVLRQARQSISAVVDAATQRVGTVSPGKIVVIYGTGIGPSQLVQNRPVNGLFSTQLSGTEVSVNGAAAPILYASATQVSVIVPYSITGATAQVTVAYQGQAATAFSVLVATAAPSLFTANQTGAGQAVAINGDGTVNSAANPAKVGGLISLYATGEGQTLPPGVDGSLGDPTPKIPVLPVSVTIGGIPAMQEYAGSVAGQVAGLMQVNVKIPVGVQPGGYVPVVLKVGNTSGAPGAVWIAVSGN